MYIPPLFFFAIHLVSVDGWVVAVGYAGVAHIQASEIIHILSLFFVTIHLVSVCHSWVMESTFDPASIGCHLSSKLEVDDRMRFFHASSIRFPLLPVIDIRLFHIWKKMCQDFVGMLARGKLSTLSTTALKE